MTAIYIECKDKNIKLNGSIHVKSKYEGMSILVQLIGELVLKLENHNEEYRMTLPSFYARSIITKPWIELGGPCGISCAQTGCQASVEFILKVNKQNNKVLKLSNAILMKQIVVLW